MRSINNNTVTILHQNIQCITTSLAALSIIVNTIAVRVICLSEHWLTRNSLALINIKDFTLISCYCRDENKHGGTAIFLHNELRGTSYSEITNLSIDSEIEISALTLCLKEKISIICIYRPPTGNINIFFETLDVVLSLLFDRYEKFVILGDFNVNTMIESNNTKNFMCLLETYDLKFEINEPTRISNNSVSCLDNIITNLDNTNSYTLNTHLSDHTAQICSFVDTKEQHYSSKIIIRDYSQNNITNFKYYLSLENWFDVHVSQQLNDKWNMFIGTVMYYFDLYVPVRSITLSSKNKVALPSTPELISSSFTC